MSETKSRIIGFLCGLLLGLPYSFISQFINVWMLPGLPLLDLPVGRVAMILLTTLSMGILGLIVTWDKESLVGIIGGALFMVVTGSYLAYVNGGSYKGTETFLVFIFTFLPRVVLFVPIALFLRWVSEQFEQVTTQTAGILWRLTRVLVAILLAAGIGGSFSLLSSEARQALQDANQLTLDGISSVAQQTELPAALIPVEGFSRVANGAYTLNWSDRVDNLNVVRPETDGSVIESLIIIRFDNGYKFGCVYTPPSHTPKCINITQAQ
jgi:hypothetical protein